MPKVNNRSMGANSPNLVTLMAVWSKNTIYNIQRKIQQNSDFAQKRDLNPVPNGEVAADIAKMFAK
jgi:beta-galactosidase beta subunit